MIKHLLLNLYAILMIMICAMNSAQGEDVLRILCWEGYAPPQFVSQFESYMLTKHQLEVRVEVQSVSEPDEFFQGIREGTVDIISPAHNIPQSHRWPMIQSNIVAPFDISRIDNYQHVAPFLRDKKFVVSDGKVYGIPIVYGVYGLAYNQEQFKTRPTSWDVLWDPRFIGQYVISADYYEANIYVTALSLGYTAEDIYDYDKLSDDERFVQRLSLLASNAESMWTGVDKTSDLQGRALATAWGFSFRALQQKGERWSFAMPEEGMTGWVDYWVMSSAVKRDPVKQMIAHEWVNFALGVDMQLYYVRSLSQFPVSMAIKDRLTAQEVDAFKVGDETFLKENVMLWEVLSRRQKNGFKLMWERAKQARQARKSQLAADDVQQTTWE